MSLMPININLKGKQVVIIGGGKIATRKARKILSYNAQIKVISSQISKEMMDFVHNHSIRWVPSDYHKKFLEEAFLIIAATNDPLVNLTIHKDRKPYQLINVVDQPSLSDFHMVSTFHRGKLSISVSTDGASPILAKTIVNQLSEKYGQEYEEYVEFLYHARKSILESISDKTKCQQFLKELVGDEIINNPMREQWFSERMKYYMS
ncbi:precorrin-2 dehydrogenase/sirohydrochlorin ferrochelatase family protein [Alkalihalobacterium alkalinitrilicum]|uniref:precorrin-2 dehydrogenase/sirohydrochlorin ferrochelatase family protein n=1 Tax=Alkalihalobacterium alkalinitrilicum TaxID=427920 RepID=UPI000994CCC7|nr:NAD(P)-dependent oxidoreductase [Alkalihalobacterium alkalinitrilicum]